MTDNTVVAKIELVKDTFFTVGSDPLIDKMMASLGFSKSKDVKTSEFVVFTGGEDVDPSLYGHNKLHVTYSNIKRDIRENEIYDRLGLDQKVIGICRGAQFLNVMQGGTLWQDVNNHCRTHELKPYNNTSFKWGEEFLKENPIMSVTSTHHQMMRPAKHGELIGAARETSVLLGADKEVRSNCHVDVEILYYKEAKLLCFQPHPEYGHKSTYDIFEHVLKQLEWI